MRTDYGPGYRVYYYRVYYKQTGAEIVLLLCGGDKSSQRHDIEEALALASME